MGIPSDFRGAPGRQRISRRRDPFLRDPATSKFAEKTCSPRATGRKKKERAAVGRRGEFSRGTRERESERGITMSHESAINSFARRWRLATNFYGELISL